MDMQDEWLSGLRSCAARNGNIRELWLFGSRAQGRSRLESDVDLAVVLMPPDGKHNWALGNYLALGDDAWKRELESIVGRHVSLEAIEADSDGDAVVRRPGVRLWARGLGMEP
jgi:predicted nucleotidyltransferase